MPITCVVGNNLDTHCFSYVLCFLNNSSHWSVEQYFALDRSSRKLAGIFLIGQRTSLLANENLRLGDVTRWFDL